MKLQGVKDQQNRDFMFTADGSVNNSAVLVLARSMSRSFLHLANPSTGPLWFEFDGPRATATITGGVVTSVAITNAGFNFTKPPIVRFLGGGPAGGGGQFVNTSYLGLNQPSGQAPSNVATGHAVMTGSPGNLSVSSITIDNPGSGYVIAPYVHIFSSDLDPYGCAVPSAGVGLMIAGNSSFTWQNSVCPTEAIAVFGASSQIFICRYMT